MPSVPAPSRAARRPLSGEGPVVLRFATDPRWLPLALARFDEVLVDHAHCEKKAAANALSLLQSYPEMPGPARRRWRGMAREESAHLARVLELMEERGLTLARDTGDPYAQRAADAGSQAAAASAASTGSWSPRSSKRAAASGWRCSARGTARRASCERFYAELAQSEDGHQALFFRLAVRPRARPRPAHGWTSCSSRGGSLVAASARID